MKDNEKWRERESEICELNPSTHYREEGGGEGGVLGVKATSSSGSDLRRGESVGARGRNEKDLDTMDRSFHRDLGIECVKGVMLKRNEDLHT